MFETPESLTNEIATDLAITFPLDKSAVPADALLSSAARQPECNWRPQFTAENIHQVGLTLRHDLMRFSTVKNHSDAAFVIDGADDWTQLQLGRALALRDYYEFIGTFDGYHVMSHRYERRFIIVTLRKANMYKAAIVYEAVENEDGVWVINDHPMSRDAITIERAGSAYIVRGNTFHLKDTIKAAGGKPVFTSAGKFYAWRFTDVEQIPAVVNIAANTIWWTKYHLLAKLLMGHKIALKIGEQPKNEVLDTIRDAKQRETWRIAGFDWRDFPVAAPTV